MTMAAAKNERKRDRSQSLWADAWERFRRGKLAMVLLGVIVIYFVVAALVYAGVVGAAWQEKVGPEYQPPSIEYILGTDLFGQSVWRKTIYGAKISITIAVVASGLSVLIGVPMGAAAGYFGGRVDEFVVWVYSTLSSIPGLLLILAFAFVLRDVKVFRGTEYEFALKGLPAICLALGLTSWVGLCRLIRGEVMKHKDRDYVTAARAYGASQPRIIFLHVVPNVTHLILIDLSLRFVGFIHAEVILSYLGLGVVDEASWGTMIDEAKNELTRGIWWQLAAATMAVFFISLALNIVGDRLRDALDPKLRGVD